MSEEIFKEDKIITQCDVENKELKVESIKVENEQLRKNNADFKIKESIEKTNRDKKF